MLYYKVIALLKSRGITVQAGWFPDGPFQLVDNSDGKGPFINEWDEAVLGPKPTVKELDALEAEAEIEKQEVLDTPTLEDELNSMAEVLNALVNNETPPAAALQVIDKRLAKITG